MKKILILLLIACSVASFAQVQNGGLATENGSKFFFSTVNSTSAQLAASATFTGTIESIVNQRSYSFLFVSDQNATITINQFIDAGGTKNAQQLVFTYTASSKFARSGALNGNYIQVVIQNTGGSTTTTLQADMAYGNIDASTLLNNMPHALMEINGTAVDQNSGNKSAGSQRVVVATDDINLAAINTAVTATNTKITQGQAAAASSQSVTLSNENVQDLYFTGQSAQTATVNNIIPAAVSANATDLTGYRSGSVQIFCPAGTYTTGAIIFEGANDAAAGTIFQTIPVYNQATGALINAAITLVTTTSIIYTFPVNFRYIRVRISTAVSGASASVQAFSRFTQTSWTAPLNTTVNTAQINGVTPLMGSGVNGTGAQRITIATDQAALTVAGLMSVKVDQTTVGTTNAVSLAQIGSTTTVTGGVAGTLAVGGNIAVGTLPTLNPIPLANDIGGLTRRLAVSTGGGIAGAGEIVELVNAFTAGSATAAEGTNSKTFQSIANKDADVYFGVIAQGNAADKFQIEGSYDNLLYSVIPISRTDNLAAYSVGVSGQYMNMAQATGDITPVTGAVYKGRSYGYNYIRVHQTAFTTTGTNGIIRIVPIGDDANSATSTSFSFNAANTTEAVGTLNGLIQAGGVRTIYTKGAQKGQLCLDAVTYATAAPTSFSLIVEGSNDNTNWTTLSLQPRGGGVLVTSITSVGAIGAWTGGVYDFDLTRWQYVRARLSAYTAGTATSPNWSGALKIFAPANPNYLRSSYMVAVTGQAVTAATNMIVIESGASRITRINRITIQGGTATAAGLSTLTINRNTVAASAAGTTVTAATMLTDPTDPNFSGVVRTGAFTLTGVTTTASQYVIPYPVAITTATEAGNNISYDFTNGGTKKGIAIPVGTTNGIMFSASGLTGGANFGLIVEFTEEIL